MKKSKNNDLGLFIQFMLYIVIIIFFIVSLFEGDFKLGTEISISLTLFVLAYNNIKIYKRKYFTIIYILFALMILLSLIFGVSF